MWYLDKCEVYLKLTTDSVFDVEEALNSPELSLSHKWPDVWTIKYILRRIFFPDIDRNLYIIMTNMFPNTDAKELLKNIRMFLKRPWTLTLRNGTTIPMAAELGFVSQFFLNLNTAKTANQDRRNTIQSEIPEFRLLYKNIQLFNEKISFIVTKLFFCEQIELSPSEYELMGENMLYNKITRQLLFSGEFSIFISSEFEGGEGMETAEKARVCLTDSGFEKLETNNVAGNSGSTKYIVLITLTTFLCLLIF